MALLDISDLLDMVLPPTRDESTHTILCEAEAAALMLEDWAEDIRKAGEVCNNDLTFHLELGEISKGRSIAIRHYHEVSNGESMAKALREAHNRRNDG